MVDSVPAFINEILGITTPSRRILTYRGHGNEAFALQPSIFRSAERLESEHILLRELIAAHPDEFAHDSSALEMLVRMQHFSLPTRLLDVTINPLVALYFSCQPATKSVIRLVAGVRSRRQEQASGEVVILSSTRSSIKYFDSDTVSCLTNLSRLRFSLKERIDTSLSVEDFNETLPIKRLLHFIRQEKNGFEAEICPGHLDQIFLVKPKQNNRRILAQAGAFFVFGLTQELTGSRTLSIQRITIEADAKRDIRAELDKLGINEKTLFPDIERAARYLLGSVAISAALTRLMP